MGDIAYCDLSQVKTEKTTDSNADDSVFIQYMRDATALIDEYCNQEFAPRIQTRYFDADEYTLSGYDLILDAPLLSLTEATVDGSAVTGITATPRTGDIPYTALYSTSGWSGGSNAEPIAITGVWGFRHYYSEAWATNTTLDGSIDDSTTTVNVADASSLSVGNLIRVGTEYMSVDAIATNALTVERGVRGSTPAAHDSVDTVEKWTPERDIVRACYRLAGYFHNRRGDFVSKKFEAPDFAVSFDPIPPDVQVVLDRYRRYTPRAV